MKSLRCKGCFAMSIHSVPPEDHSGATKEALTQSAMRLFTQYGCERVTVDDICADCHLTKGAFYHHFPSKDHIIVLSFNLFLDRYLQERFRYDPERPVPEQLTELYMTTMDFCYYIGKEITASNYEAGIRSRIDVRIQGRTFVQSLGQLVEQGIKEGNFSPELTFLEIYQSLVATFSGMAVKWATQSNEADRKLDWKKLLRFQLANILRPRLP